MRKRTEWIKSVFILLLTLSAFYLLLETRIYTDLTGETPFAALRRLIAGPAAVETAVELKEAALPVRVAVTGQNGRFGVQYDAAAAEQIYGELRGLFSEAMGTAQPPIPVTREEWRAALLGVGVYFDFLGAVPLQALSAWLSGGISNELLSGSARRLAITGDRSGAVLVYYIDAESGRYYACRTAEALSGRLDGILAPYLPNGATFAFEEGAAYDSLDPNMLLLTRRPSRAVLSASSPLQSEERLATLLGTLGFNPHMIFSYTVSGEQVLREGLSTLRIAEDGGVTYHDAGDDRLSLAYRGERLTLTELIEGTRRIAERTVGAYCGSARIYLKNAAENPEGSYTVRYDYSVDGSPVVLSGSSAAAVFTVAADRITDCSFYFRAYEATPETRALLPEFQAAAALRALDHAGGELIAGYVDTGEADLYPEWIVWSEA